MIKAIILLLLPTLFFSQSRKLVIYEETYIDSKNVVVEPVEVNQAFETFIIYSKSNPRMYSFDTFGLATFPIEGINYKLYQIEEFTMTSGGVRDGRRVFKLRVKFNGGEHNFEIFEIR